MLKKIVATILICLATVGMFVAVYLVASNVRYLENNVAKYLLVALYLSSPLVLFAVAFALSKIWKKK